MKKMMTIFKKDKNNKVTSEPNDGMEWVFNGEGIPRTKLDGTACAVIDGKLYKRYDCKLITKGKKKGQRKTPPVGFLPCDESPDPITNHWPGWTPVLQDDKWHLEALSNSSLLDGTYELIGPKIQNNPYGISTHLLINHQEVCIEKITHPITYESITKDLTRIKEEGIVFHGKNGRMAKIRRSDFGLSWPIL